MGAWTTEGRRQLFEQNFLQRWSTLNTMWVGLGPWEISIIWRILKYIQTKSLFGALFRPKVWLDLTSSKTTIERLSPSTQSVMVIWQSTVFFACYWRIRLGEYVVTKMWCHVPHNSNECGFIARDNISHRCDINWPLETCNLSPLDVFPLQHSSICVRKWTKSTSKESVLTSLSVEVI